MKDFPFPTFMEVLIPNAVFHVDPTPSSYTQVVVNT